jgi:gentisate 1,2-dioxygenase
VAAELDTVRYEAKIRILRSLTIIVRQKDLYTKFLAGQGLERAFRKPPPMLLDGDPTTTQDADRRAWRDAHIQPLWENRVAHTGAPPAAEGTLWPWRTMKPLVDRATVLATPAVAERRVLSMIHPKAKPGEYHTITNFNAGLQVILPGEVARPHRHSMDALRFVLDGSGAATRVHGKVAPMSRGDLVLTPAWCWHEHWHDGDAPIVWLDVLNVHTHEFLETLKFEPGPVHDVPDLPDDASFAFANMVPDLPASRAYSPVFRYPLDAAQRAVEAAPRSADGTQRVRYVNPLSGGPVLPYLDCWLIKIAAGTTTVPFRTNAHAVCAVVEGSGETRIGAQTLAWERNDVFTLPHDVPIVHAAQTDTLIFLVSDRELYRRLDLLEETYG